MWTCHLAGTVGGAVVAAVVTLQDDRRFVEGRDFYADGVDIPPAGARDATTLALRERGGGTFRFHLADPASKLDFGEDPRLDGVWTRGGDTRPARLHVTDRDAGRRPARLYGAVTRVSDRRFEARVRGLVGAVLAGDKDFAARVVSYPLGVDDERISFVTTRAELMRRWGRVFTPAVPAAFRHDMIVNDAGDGVDFAEGVAWFNGRGLDTVNVDWARSWSG